MTTPIEPDELRRRLDAVSSGPTTAVFDDVFVRAHRQRRVWRSGLVAATVVLVAAAIAVPTLLVSQSPAPQQLVSTPRPTSPPPTSPPLPGVHTDPAALVGRWHLQATGEAPGTSLILGDELSLFRPCGLLQGDWRADHQGLFIGDVDSGDGACFHTPQSFAAPWLKAAVGYRVQGPDRVLLDAAGQIVARLSPGAHSTTGPNDASSYADAPTLTPALRALLQVPAPLPAGLRPASLADIMGRWRALGPHRGSPLAFIAFNDDNSWTGSDGCNGAGGRLAVGSDGEILTTSGGSTVVGCDNSPAPGWVSQARRVGLDGSVLVLLDVEGKELGRLAPQ